jgi:threonine/homoserine/homoserine lactone efflux protein
MDVVGILSAIAVVQFLAAASPGPNFILVTSVAMAGSRRAALPVVAGVLLGTLSWAVLAACGLGVLLAKAPGLYSALELACAAYLVWLGAKMLMAAWRQRGVVPAAAAKPASAWHGLRLGYLTNMINPKSMAYYSSLFVVMMPADPPLWLFAAAVATAMLASIVWWIAMMLFFAAPPVRRGYERARRFIDAALGGVLVAIGVRMAVGGR